MLDKNNPPTNEELNDLLDGLIDFLGEQFIGDIKEAFKDKTNVDLDSPIVYPEESGVTEEAEKTYSIPSGIGRTTSEEKEGILEALKNGNYETFKRYMPSSWDEEKKKSAYLNSGGVFDGGGIANGLGYMPKATKKTETVNGPDLTAQILSPQSNREWETYARTMGIMFEQAHNFASNPIIERVGGNTDNSVNNSGQVNIASVNFPSEAQHAPLSTLLAQFKTLPN